jgi:hypothetical protein
VTIILFLDSLGPTNRSYVLYSEVGAISPGDNISGEILIDNTLGRNTQFMFDYDKGDIVPTVTSPNGTVYIKSNSEVVVHDTQFRLYRFTIPNNEFQVINN